MDAPGCFTLEKKGSKRAPAQTSGKEKVRLSCLMTATARDVYPPKYYPNFGYKYGYEYVLVLVPVYILKFL